MQNDLSINDAINDPLIAQLRQADGMSTERFARLLVCASDAYTASAIVKLHDQRVDMFYRGIGAGPLDSRPSLPPTKVDPWQLCGPVSSW